MKARTVDRLAIAALALMMVVGTLIPVVLYAIFGDVQESSMMNIKAGVSFQNR